MHRSDNNVNSVLFTPLKRKRYILFMHFVVFLLDPPSMGYLIDLTSVLNKETKA